MDTETLQRMLETQAMEAGFSASKVKGMVTDAIDQAGPYMWGSYKWRFRRKEKPLTLTASQEYAELPDDFAQFFSLSHRDGTSEGWQLTYKTEDFFEYTHPNPTMISEGGPRSVKIVHNSTEGVNRAYFSPIPDSAYTPMLVYFCNFGSSSRIPEGYDKVFLAACWLFIYAVGSDSWMKADIAYNRAKAEAIKDIDPMYQGTPSHVERASRFANFD